jgi:hypothetical protein
MAAPTFAGSVLHAGCHRFRLQNIGFVKREYCTHMSMPAIVGTIFQPNAACRRGAPVAGPAPARTPRPGRLSQPAA